MPVRIATLADARAIAEVHVASWQTSYRGIVPAAMLDELSVERRTVSRTEILANPTRSFPTWVAMVEDAVVGFADYGMSRDVDVPPGTMELYAIYLRQEFQRRGLGHELWEPLVGAMKPAGAKQMTVWVLEANFPGRQFYEKLGFSADGAVKYFKQGSVSLPEVRYRFTLE